MWRERRGRKTRNGGIQGAATAAENKKGKSRKQKSFSGEIGEGEILKYDCPMSLLNNKMSH